MESRIFKGHVVGISFEPAKTGFKQAIDEISRLDGKKRLKEGTVKLSLRHNPANQYDNQAVEVHMRVGTNDYFVGHVPKPFNTKVLEAGIDKVMCSLDQFNIFEGSIVGLDILVEKK